MKIIKTNFIAGARQAQGIAVIIDVFRAFSVSCYCLSQGAKTVIPVGQIQSAIDIATQHSGSVLIGERNGVRLPGFALGNSPTEVLGYDMSTKTVVHTTHAGTQGIVQASNAEQVLTGALVNAKATAQYILSQQPEQVTLVSMGLEAKYQTDEDTECANYIEALLLGKKPDRAQLIEKLLRSPCSQRFFDPQRIESPESDFYHCTDIDCFDFAVAASTDQWGNLSLGKVK
ncbi:MAG: 2-phosphosulfolactate phosphatase [Osedax symbiont Rs2]|nr:MAG: 2-phosphosulfolactate phosphatase [Osedax symbiont Rs2]